MTLEDIETALAAHAEAPGLWVNEQLALAGNVAVVVEDVTATFVDGTVVTLAPRGYRHAAAGVRGRLWRGRQIAGRRPMTRTPIRKEPA